MNPLTISEAIGLHNLPNNEVCYLDGQLQSDFTVFISITRIGSSTADAQAVGFRDRRPFCLARDSGVEFISAMEDLPGCDYANEIASLLFSSPSPVMFALPFFRDSNH